VTEKTSSRSVGRAAARAAAVATRSANRTCKARIRKQEARCPSGVRVLGGALLAELKVRQGRKVFAFRPQG